MKDRIKLEVKRNTIALAIGAMFAVPAFAVDFEVGDGWQGVWNTSASIGTSWRARDPDSKFMSAANSALSGGSSSSSAPNTIDEGNQNYRKGDRFSTLLKVISEVEIKKGNAGMLVRGKAWYDYTLNKEGVRLGSQNNGYNGYNPATNTLGGQRPLSDNGFENLNKFDGTALLDAYVYNTFDGIGGLPLQARVGNQVVNWGESLFIQGLNQINPIDVPSFRKPGVQLKEVFIPVPIAHASHSLGSAGTVEAFYQWKWVNTPIEAGCGNYWSVALGSISSSPGSCNSATPIGPVSNPLAIVFPGAAIGSPFNGLFMPTIDGKKARDSGEYGVAYRFNVDKLDTEFGLYAMNIHSRIPNVSLQVAKTPGQYGNSPAAAFWEYPEDMKLFGVSASTNIAGWSLAGELSQTRNFAAQIDGNDLLFAGLNAGAGVAVGPYGKGAVASAASNNGYVQGFTRTNKTQLQFNTVKAGNGLLGAAQYVFVAEVGFQTNDLPDYKKDPNAIRYGRPFITGAGTSPSYGGVCPSISGLNSNPDGCQNKGYVTKNAWGYRLKADFTYNDVFGSGLTAIPGVFFSHDVKGYSVDSQFIEDRMALGLNLRLTYQKKYNLDLGSVMYNHSAAFDPLHDRDFYSATFSTSF